MNLRTEIDADGVLVVTWDMPGRSMNVIDEAVIGELEKTWQERAFEISNDTDAELTHTDPAVDEADWEWLYDPAKQKPAF